MRRLGLVLLLLTGGLRGADVVVPAAEYLISAEAIGAGQTLFVAACAACHGKSGEGARGPNLADGGLIRRLNNTRLFASIRHGVPGTDMPGFPMPDAKVWQTVAFVRSLSAPAMDASVAGDATRGASVFFGKGGCQGCHMIRGRGGVIGPDLSNVGALMTLKRLRESVVDPDARIAEGFRAVTLETASGEKIEGVAKNSNNYSIQVLDKTGRLHLLDAREVRTMRETGKSIMPGDLGKQLSVDEMRDLIAFLARQSVRSERVPPSGRKG